MTTSKSRALETPAQLPSSAVAPASTSVEVERDVLRIFDQFGPRLLRYVRSFGLHGPDTEDVVQDVFLSLFRHLHLGRPQSNVQGWVFRVAHNLALKHRQRNRRRLPDANWIEAWNLARPDPSDGPEDTFAGDQRQQRLAAVLAALPELDRRCVCLRAEGLTYREIARVVGVSHAGVAKALTRAVTRLANADR